MSADRRPLARWAPALVWAAVIFLASTSWFSGTETHSIVVPFLHWLFPRAEHHTLEALHALIRKLGHFTEYLVFGLLLVRGLGDEAGWSPRRAALAIVLATAYAVTDELHQHFVPGRTAAATDVLIDGVGALTGQLAVAASRLRVRSSDSPRSARARP